MLDTIIKYSNDFKGYTDKERSKDEWMYMIPTLSLYAALGFLTGIKNDRMKKFVDFNAESERIVDSTLNLVGQLSDVLDDYNEKKLIEEEVDKIKEEQC